jgi:16S rRNA G966 N2-methylase RsmD
MPHTFSPVLKEGGHSRFKIKQTQSAQLRQENIHWKDQYARIEKSCQEWKEQFMRVEQERIRLLARLEELVAQQDLVFYPPPYATHLFNCD